MTGPRCRRRLSTPLLAACAIWTSLGAEVAAQGSAASDRAVLETLYDATGGPNWIDNTNWKMAAPLGEWFGVTTDTAGRVTRLQLPGNGLSGPIPATLGELALLRNLDFGGSRWDSEAQQPVENMLTGQIPVELGNLANLERLSLGSNALTGPVPSRLGRLTSLRWLDLSGNDLTGPVPAELGDLANLEWLYLRSNPLTGSLPQDLTRLSQLSTLDISNTGACAPVDAEFQAWLETIRAGMHRDCVASDEQSDPRRGGPGAADPADHPPASPTAPTGRVGRNAAFGYDLLDPTTNINRKQRLILHRKQDGTLAPDRVLVGGALVAVANAQWTNRSDKFGYLMRHPTAANQVGTTVSEAALHSFQLGVVGTLGDWITTNAEFLYDPQQSFGAGINTALERNQVQVRRGYALLGDLDRSPLFVSLGKMAVPFGLTDTVNPFTASTVWHAFGGLANGVQVGYSRGGVNLTVMGIQGGAQFRAANTPVNGTSVPSRLNNFSVDASYARDVRSVANVLVGGSYQKGTAYCQGFPVVHFEPCADNNPAFDLYGRLVYRKLTLKGEFAQTIGEWPGTFNPAMPQFAASPVTSFDVGIRFRHELAENWLDLSAEFSEFDAGPGGAPWERQEQLVLGVAWFARRSAKLFAEYVRIAGYVPLSFITGGNIRNEMGELLPDRTHSDRSAHSQVVLLGAGIAF